jgi:hypothetical protein
VDIATKKKYRNAWKCVEAEFQKGFCVSERGLQSALASALKAQFPKTEVVIEPYWKIKGKGIAYVPDVVLVKDMKILDVFELKFVPHSYAKFERDIEKLALYSDRSNECFAVRLDPCTGEWRDNEALLRENCQFHFVAVARADAAAVWTESLGEGRLSGTGRFHHWYGRVGIQERAKWDISFGI